MKVRLAVLFITLILPIGLYRAIARPPVIVSLDQYGVLTCTNLSPDSIATVAWASTPQGPWFTDLKGLNAVAVATNGSIRVNVPLSSKGMVFYRVLGFPAFDPDQGMTLIPGGSFTMGDSMGDGIVFATPTNIDLSSFYMDTNLVTDSQWQSVFAYATNDGYSFDDAGTGKNNAANQPIQTINWYDAVKWCNARSQKAGLIPVYYTDVGQTQIYTNGDTDSVYPNWTANGYQLPTEAQWEKAARGGVTGLRFPWGNTISESQANYYGDTTNLLNYYDDTSFDLGPNGDNTNFDSGAEPYTSPVGYFPANGYGLYDMAGNLQEWCWDWYGPSYGLPSTNNPTGPASGAYDGFRVTRGGFWGFPAFAARCAYRSQNGPSSPGNNTGLRCVKNP